MLVSVLLDLLERDEMTCVLLIALAAVAGTISQIIVAEGTARLVARNYKSSFL